MATKAEQEVLVNKQMEIRNLITEMAKLAEEIEPFLEQRAEYDEDYGDSESDYSFEDEEYEDEHKVKMLKVNVEICRLRDELHEYESRIIGLLDEQLALVQKTQERPHNSSPLDLTLNEALKFLSRNYSTFKEDMTKGVADLQSRDEDCGSLINFVLSHESWAVDNLNSLFQIYPLAG